MREYGVYWFFSCFHLHSLALLLNLYFLLQIRYWYEDFQGRPNFSMHCFFQIHNLTLRCTSSAFGTIAGFLNFVAPIICD